MAYTVENLALVMANLSHSIEELKATIASLNSTIDSLKAENEYLKNNNELLHEENAYLKRKLFGTKSEKITHSMDQLSLFDETENECEPELLEDISYTHEHGNDIKVRDSEGIQLANAKIDEIKCCANSTFTSVLTPTELYGTNTYSGECDGSNKGCEGTGDAVSNGFE